MFRAVLHGSFRKSFEAICKARALFTAAGIEVLAPEAAEIAAVKDGFALFAGQEHQDPRLIEIHYLHHLKRLGREGFSYFICPDGEIGRSASYELGIAQATNVPCFFSEKPKDHPVYFHANSIWSPENLAAAVMEHGCLPAPKIKKDEKAIHALWQELVVPGSVVATGAIIARGEETLLVKTHKWGGRWSMVGGKVRRNERLADALLREVKEETGLAGQVGAHLCTFDQIKDSGYYLAGTNHVFVDHVVEVEQRRVRLNDEAQDWAWLPPREALAALDIEPNARHTLELYVSHLETQGR
jgi:ADP-ribose pyrophosphatase YjhB (NUDIX family)